MNKQLKGKKILVIGNGRAEAFSTARKISEAGGEVTAIDHTFQLLENREKGAASLDKYDMIFVSSSPSDQSVMENILLQKINQDLCIPVLSMDQGGRLIRS